VKFRNEITAVFERDDLQLLPLFHVEHVALNNTSLLEFPTAFLQFIIFSGHMRYDAHTSVIYGDLYAIVDFTFVTQLLLMLYWTCCEFLFVSMCLRFPLFTYTAGPVKQEPNKCKIYDSTETLGQANLRKVMNCRKTAGNYRKGA
jgi:hypothetical protein